MVKASTLCLLSDLDTKPDGLKVRFLGCVQQYDVVSATLFLRHEPSSGRRVVTAAVNVDSVLESLASSDLDVGAWVNVIGYCRTRADVETDKSKRRRSGHDRNKSREVVVHVDAVMTWSAGAIALADYKEAVRLRLAVQSTDLEP